MGLTPTLDSDTVHGIHVRNKPATNYRSGVNGLVSPTAPIARKVPNVSFFGVSVEPRPKVFCVFMVFCGCAGYAACFRVTAMCSGFFKSHVATQYLWISFSVESGDLVAHIGFFLSGKSFCGGGDHRPLHRILCQTITRPSSVSSTVALDQSLHILHEIIKGRPIRCQETNFIL